MTKIYLIHGWGGNSKLPLFNWLKEELRGNRDVLSFEMPNTNEPKIEEWVRFLKNKININNLDSKTYFLGHSIGCQAIMRYLESLPNNIKIGGCVFVAGWFNLSGLNEEEKIISKQWVEKEIDFKKVKSHTKNFLAIFSNNDPVVPILNVKLFKKNLGAKIIIKKDEKHFDNTKQIKEILEFLKK